MAKNESILTWFESRHQKLRDETSSAFSRDENVSIELQEKSGSIQLPENSAVRENSPRSTVDIDSQY